MLHAGLFSVGAMSGKTARKARRDVRRAVGADAIAIIEELTGCINSNLFPGLNAATSAIRGLQQQLATLHGQTQQLEKRVRALETRTANG